MCIQVFLDFLRKYGLLRSRIRYWVSMFICSYLVLFTRTLNEIIVHVMYFFLLELALVEVWNFWLIFSGYVGKLIHKWLTCFEIVIWLCSSWTTLWCIQIGLRWGTYFEACYLCRGFNQARITQHIFNFDWYVFNQCPLVI